MLELDEINRRTLVTTLTISAGPQANPQKESQWPNL
jgi:hypothetical protein